jgi:hypothetical protein
MKKTKRRIIILGAITLCIAASVVLYLIESDRVRLSRAYEYNSPVLCNLIWDKDTRLRCLGVLAGDFKACETITGYDSSVYCFYGAAITNDSPSKLETLVSGLAGACMKQGLNESDCRDSGIIVKDLVLINRAYQRGDPKSCLAASDSGLWDGCFAILSGNDSLCQSCSSEDCYKLCESMFYRAASQCNGEDMCYSSVAYYTSDKEVCKLINEVERRRECFISVRDEPIQLGKL